MNKQVKRELKLLQIRIDNIKAILSDLNFYYDTTDTSDIINNTELKLSSVESFIKNNINIKLEDKDLLQIRILYMKDKLLSIYNYFKENNIDYIKILSNTVFIKNSNLNTGIKRILIKQNIITLNKVLFLIKNNEIGDYKHISKRRKKRLIKEVNNNFTNQIILI